MTLKRLQIKFERRLDMLQNHLQEHLTLIPPSLRSRRQLCEMEGVLSESWQLWCKFCRDVVMESCLGSVRECGAIVPPTHPSKEVVSFIATRQSKGKPPAKGGVNTILQKEPTWGHLDKLQDVINALAPSNQGELKQAFGLIPKVEHIRLIRNCSAHRNRETFADIKAFQHEYRAFSTEHPLQALYWEDPVNGQLLMTARMDDMRAAARNAVA